MKLPVISGKELVKVLVKIGFEVDHITGSHIILRKITYPYTRITVPNHKEIAKGTLRAIIIQVGLTREAFFELLGK